MSGSRNRGNDRFYSPPGMRRHQQQQMMIQREREMMFLQFQHQQQQQQQQQQVHLMMMMRYFEEQQRQRRLLQQQFEEQQMALRQEIPVQPITEERASEVEESLLVDSSMIQTNIDRLVETVTPSVPVQYLSQPRPNGQEACEATSIQFYNLDDLWESYREWSAYGAGVELKLNGNENENVTQYFVPSLSIIQLYVDPTTASIDTISQKINQMSISPSSSAGESFQSNGKLVFEYQENEPPHQRKPLFDKISALANGFPDLMKYRSCDLLPTSWISVAWYPIYRIPTGPSLKTLDASFLTFHHLSTQTSDKSGMGASASSKVALPVFGLVSYKLKSPILPLQDSDQKLSDSLFESAKSWIEHLHVYHPDFNFFIRNGKSSDTDTDPDQTQKA